MHSHERLPAWLSGLWDSYQDGYAISPGRVDYDDGSDGAWRLNFTGNIRHVSVFDGERGVIIIEYDAAPEVPYEKGRSNFLAIYYRRAGENAAKFWNSYDMTGTDTLTLEEALVKFSEENSARFVFSWDSAYTLYRQDAPVFDMGNLRGNWRADDAFGTCLRITDLRVGVYMAVISAATVVYTGAIVRATDSGAREGRITIRFSQDDDCGLVMARLDAKAGDCYALAWRRGDDGTLSMTVYNDNPAALAGSAEELDGAGAEIFAETENGLAGSGTVSADFVKA